MSSGIKRTPREVRNGQVVSDEALAAFYRQRSESLRRTPNTTTVAPTGNPVSRAGGLWNYLTNALAGKVGQ